MPSLRKIFRYKKHYGTKSTVGLIYEKLVIDKRRFSPKRVRRMPSFNNEYNALPLPEASSSVRPLNILYALHYFYPSKKGGTERFTLNLAKEQVRLGNLPTVLVLEANEPISAYSEVCGDIFYRYYEYDGIRCIGFRHRRAPLGLYYKAVRLDDDAMRDFARYIIKELKIDLVHATYPQPFASFLYECDRIGIPYVITCTDFCMCCHYSTLVDKEGGFCRGSDGGVRCSKICKTYGCADPVKRKKNAEIILLGASAVTVPSDFVARILSAEFRGLKILTAPHGISDAFEYRKRCGRVKNFLYAGTLSPLKGVHLLIDAFKSVKGDITLDIYGDGDKSYIKKLKSSADGRIAFHPAVSAERMPEIYQSADCVILPSMWYETYNFVLREALKTGAFAIAADIGAMPEAITEGKNGYLFAPADKESLSKKIRLASEFDFEGYEQKSFPTLADEAGIYQRIYQKSAQ